jgi:hypothetical protein
MITTGRCCAAISSPEQDVVGKLEIRLVDLVDQQHVAVGSGKHPPERSELDVVANVRHIALTETGVVETLQRVVDIQALRGLGGRLDVPRFHRQAQPLGNMQREQRLAGAGLALDQQGTLQGDRAVHCLDE